jgi:hypothetical protein
LCNLHLAEILRPGAADDKRAKTTRIGGFVGTAAHVPTSSIVLAEVRLVVKYCIVVLLREGTRVYSKYQAASVPHVHSECSLIVLVRYRIRKKVPPAPTRFATGPAPASLVFPFRSRLTINKKSEGRSVILKNSKLPCPFLCPIPFSCPCH